MGQVIFLPFIKSFNESLASLQLPASSMGSMLYSTPTSGSTTSMIVPESPSIFFKNLVQHNQSVSSPGYGDVSLVVFQYLNFYFDSGNISNVTVESNDFNNKFWHKLDFIKWLETNLNTVIVQSTQNQGSYTLYMTYEDQAKFQKWYSNLYKEHKIVVKGVSQEDRKNIHIWLTKQNATFTDTSNDYNIIQNYAIFIKESDIAAHFKLVFVGPNETILNQKI